MRRLSALFLITFVACSLSSCSTVHKARQYDVLRENIRNLSTTLDRERQLKDQAISQLGAEKATLLAEKDKEIERLLSEKKALETARDISMTKEAELNTVVKNKERTISGLEAEISTLKARNYAMNTKILALEAKKDAVLGAVEEKESKISELEAARLALEKSLTQELSEYKTKLEMTERGLVITFLAEIFFDSGKNIIKESAKPTINKVATVLKEKVPDSYIAVEGYTDNDPIKHSAWESNWELSSARALAVLHELINMNTVNPKRLSAVGYGEYRPVESNATPAGKQQNRRVEIVILPTKIEKVKDGTI